MLGFQVCKRLRNYDCKFKQKLIKNNNYLKNFINFIIFEYRNYKCLIPIKYYSET